MLSDEQIEIAELQIRRKLQPFVQHKLDCHQNERFGLTINLETVCTCGLDAILKELEDYVNR